MTQFIIRHYQRFILILLIAMSVLYIANIPAMKIGIDEAWIGEQAYCLAKTGTVQSEMFQEYPGSNEPILLYHKAFVWTGALFIKIFGFSLYSLRLVSLLSFVFLILLLYYYCRKYSDVDIFRITSLLLLLCPLIFRNSNLYRPEMMLCAFGFISYWLLDEYFKNRGLFYLVMSAILAGFSALIHLNGFIFIGAGLVLLLYEKKWGLAVLYLIVSTAVASLYLYDAIGQMALLRQQFDLSASNAVDNLSWSMPFKNLLNEHKRLFRKPEIIGITVMFLLSAFYWLKYETGRKRHLIFYAFSLIILMGLMNHHKTTKYAIVMFPYFALLSAENIQLIIKEPGRLKNILQKLFVILLILFLVVGIQFGVSNVLYDKENWGANHRSAVAQIPMESRILAPIKFMYNEIDNFEISGILAAQKKLSRSGYKFSPENLTNWAEIRRCQYIIINDDYKRQLGCTISDTTCLALNDFRYFYSSGEYDIYEAVSPDIDNPDNQ